MRILKAIIGDPSLGRQGLSGLGKFTALRALAIGA
jgi:hypothetical protein